MEILKIILITVLIIVALFLIIALFVKKQYAVEQEIIINKSNHDVFNYVKYLKNQDHYSKWVRTGPNMKKILEEQMEPQALCMHGMVIKKQGRESRR